MKRRILLTGASGFVGSWLTRHLVAQGDEVVAFFRGTETGSIFFTEHLDQKVTVVNKNLEDFKAVEKAIVDHEVESVIHLGAQAIVETGLKLPLPTMETNVRGTWNVLEASRVHDDLVSAIVVASSDKAYGDLEGGAYVESDALRGNGPYDVSKSCCDLISHSYAATYGMPVTISRCGNIYGGGDPNSNRLIPGTIISYLRGEAPLLRSDGTYVRDYNYVLDIARSYDLLHQHTIKKKPRGEAFNFSTEAKYNVLDVVKMIQELMGSGLSPKILNQAKSEIKYQHLDSSKARKVLGWHPKYDLKAGLKETIEWYRKNYDHHK